MARILEGQSDLEIQRTRAFDGIPVRMSDGFLNSLGVGHWSPLKVFFETGVQLARKKRQIDRSWLEYHRAAVEYESVRMRLIVNDGSLSSSNRNFSLSSTLQQNLKIRDMLFNTHEKLLADFMRLQSQHQQIRELIDSKERSILDSKLQLIDVLDKRIEQTTETADDLRSKLDASKAAYRGVLLRLEEISGEIRKDTVHTG